MDVHIQRTLAVHADLKIKYLLFEWRLIDGQER